MIKLDILGRVVAAPSAAVAELRDLAAARAGVSSSHRDLSLVLDRALLSKTMVVLQRGEARALLELIEDHPADTDVRALVDDVRGALK